LTNLSKIHEQNNKVSRKIMELGGSFDLDVYLNKPLPEILLTRPLFYLKFFIHCMMFKAGMNFKVKTNRNKPMMIFWFSDLVGLQIIHEKML